MDKFKAIQYFLAAAHTGSLSAAARQQGVTLQAVAKSIAALETHLGAALFQRSSKGLRLTPDGSQYAETCAPLLMQLQAADEGLRQGRQRPQGTLVVGGTPFFLQHCVVPALPTFHDNFPDLTVDLRTILHLDEAGGRDCDLLVLHGWFDASDWVRRELPLMPQVTVAAPTYWRRFGMPQHPRDLVHHNCLCYRNPYGKLLDLWRFRQGGQASGLSEGIEQVIVRGWLHSNHRDNLLELALGGGGVMRIPQVSEHVSPARGLLVPVLQDWEVMDLPPLAIYFRPEQRRALRVRVFVDFVTDRLEEMVRLTNAEGQPHIDSRPGWHHGSSHRASTWLTRR